MKIYIDADGCPVIKETIHIANKYNIETVIVCDTSHLFNYENIEIITVSKGNDSVDFKIVNQISKGDIVVTQDYGLAAMVLTRKGIPITQNGLIITNDNIPTLLQSRYISKVERSKGTRLKGPKKRTKKQNEIFIKSIINLIEDIT